MGLNAGPSAGSGPAGKNATNSTIPVTRIAATRLMIGRIRGRRFGALAMRTAGRSATGGAIVTDASLSLRLLFRGLLLAAPREFGHHGRVGERRGVTQRPIFRNVAQQATHDLARAGLGRFRVERKLPRAAEFPIPFPKCSPRPLGIVRQAYLPPLRRTKA